jgi:capsule polysaccharide export protein KpsE/RkpR
MTESSNESDRQPFDFVPLFLIVFRKKKAFLFNCIFAVIAAAVYSFLIVKVEYRSSITFLPPKAATSDISLQLSEKTSLHLQSYDIMNEQIFSLFESKAIKRKIIDHFNLFEKYRLAKNNNKTVLAEKKLGRDLTINVSETGYMAISKMLAFTLSAYSTSPDTAQQIAQFAFFLIDSAIQKISSDRARRNRFYIEKQLTESNKRLDSLQETMRGFQEKNKTINIQEQVMFSIQTYSNIKTLMEKNELLLKNLKTAYSNDIPRIQEIEKNIEIYKNKLNEIERDTLPDVFPGFARYSKIFPEYINLVRDIEVKQYLIRFLIKEAEQAKLQEEKSVSNLIIIDPPTVPEYKSRPKRVFLMGKIIVAYLLVLFAFLFVYEALVVKRANNPPRR